MIDDLRFKSVASLVALWLLFFSGAAVQSAIKLPMGAQPSKNWSNYRRA
jgi:hypothetical protein